MKNSRPAQFRPSWAPTRAQNTAAWSAEYARRNPRGSAIARGYDKDWRAVRAQVLAVEPMCQMCAANGIERRAEMVDHIIPIRRAPERRLDPTNMMPLCFKHHRKKSVADGSWGMGRGMAGAGVGAARPHE